LEIMLDVAASPSALYRRTRIDAPSSKPSAARPARTPRTPSSSVACETCWKIAIERTLPGESARTPEDPAAPRGRSRGVSRNTADPPRIKTAASHNRSKLLIMLRIEPGIEIDVFREQVVVHLSVRGVGLDDGVDGDHGRSGLVEVAVNAGGERGGHGGS